MPMADASPSDAPTPEDAKVREEWRRLERQRIDEEIAEAREDVGGDGSTCRGPHWLVWAALALALVAGIVVTAIVNGLYDPRQ
ncbi:MAG: hypothetical protein ACKOZU_04490 [Planctomycetaceae bacterium]